MLTQNPRMVSQATAAPATKRITKNTGKRRRAAMLNTDHPLKDGAMPSSYLWTSSRVIGVNPVGIVATKSAPLD